MFKNLEINPSLAFTAGCLGALANSLTVWFFGVASITGLLGVGIAPALTPAWLYPRIVWGGLWGFLFMAPVMKGKSIHLKGALFSIFPTLIQLLVVFPLKAKKGVLGLDIGLATPVFVIVFNLVWGLVAAEWIRRSNSGAQA